MSVGQICQMDYDNHLVLRGSCFLDGFGRFVVQLSTKDGPRFPLSSDTFRDFIREHYDFLMSDDEVSNIFGCKIVRQFTPNAKLPKIKFNVMGIIDIELVRTAAGGFCLMTIKLPFINQEASWDQHTDAGADTNNDVLIIDEE